MNNTLNRKIKIIIADFSSFSRLVLTDILNAEVDLEVLDTAENGDELLLKIKEHQPDLIIADYNLPKNSRMFTFRRIQLEFSIPILLLVGKEQVAENFILEVMKVGVYDYVQTATSSRFPPLRNIQHEIIQKVRAVMDIKFYQQQINQTSLFNQEQTGFNALIKNKHKVKAPRSFVVIGASTGGTKAIEAIVKALKPKLNTVILIALHLPSKFTRTFTNRIKNLTGLKVVEGKEGLKLENNNIIIAPGDKNMIVSRPLGTDSELQIAFSDEPADEYDCPSVDILMKSVANYVGPCTLGIILTGMGKDGTVGAHAILNQGGETIAQDEATSAIYGMAKSAIEEGNITKVLSLYRIPDYINRFAEFHQI